MFPQCHSGEPVEVILTPKQELFVVCARCRKAIAQIEFSNIMLLPSGVN